MESETNGIELDLPPEYCRYRDEGCEMASSCLNCPLPGCVHELPGGRQRWLKRQRDKEMTRRFTAEGIGVKELAQSFGVSPRTVQRALKGNLSTSSAPSPPFTKVLEQLKEDENE